MQHFDGEFERLVREGVLPTQTALLYATNPTNLALELADLDQHADDEPIPELANEASEDHFFEP